MMQSSNNTAGSNAAADLNCTPEGRIFVQREVRSRFIAVANVIFQNLTQMCLARDNDVVHTSRRIDPIGRSAKPLQGVGAQRGLLIVIKRSSAGYTDGSTGK
jgi:hypothetical protein